MTLLNRLCVRLACVGLFAFVPFIYATAHAAASVQPGKYASILMDYESGKVLYARRADLQRYPASLTKIMTLYMVFEALQSGRITLDQQFKTSRKATQQSPSKLGLRVGETISVKNIILALVTKSANDAAVVIAEALGGTEANFAKQMTQKARHIGMHNTTFRNASGLHHRAQVTTARDMAKLGRQILTDFPEYYAYFSVRTFTYKGIKFGNHNKLLRSYKGADGIKTGFINASGFNLVTSVKRGDKRLIGVVFGGVSGTRRDSHMTSLLDKGFRVYRHMATRPLDMDTIGQAKRDNISDKPIKPVLAALQMATDSRQSYGAVQAAQAVQGNTAAAMLQKTQVGGAWGVQVGAYRNRESAYGYAAQVMGLIPTLPSAKVYVQQRTKRNMTIYQSQIIGLSQQVAQSVCTTVLDATALSCVVVDTTQN